jgi:YesN/AraC family two-component response regulator
MKVIICDDQAIIRDGLEMLLKLEKDIEVLGQAQDGAEAVDMAKKTSPDLVLMDLKCRG